MLRSLPVLIRGLGLRAAMSCRDEAWRASINLQVKVMESGYVDRIPKTRQLQDADSVEDAGSKVCLLSWLKVSDVELAIGEPVRCNRFHQPVSCPDDQLVRDHEAGEHADFAGPTLVLVRITLGARFIAGEDNPLGCQCCRPSNVSAVMSLKWVQP